MRFDARKATFQFYRAMLSPVLHTLAGPGAGCRFVPSCGKYAEEAFQLHRPVRALALTLRRLSRCHPWGSSGWDPVPAVISRSDLKR